MAEEKVKLAVANFMGDISTTPMSNFYMPNSMDQLGQNLGIFPEKLIIPREYHKVIAMCYDFYQRGGIVATVVNRLEELSMTKITNGQRSTTDEGNEYFDAVLHRKPSRLNRFIHTAALEYFLSGMVLPRVEWQEVLGEELSPKLKAKKKYVVPIVDMYPPQLVRVDWPGWGVKKYYLKLPEKEVRIIRSGGKVKDQQKKARYVMWENDYPSVFQAVKNGEKEVEIETDAILRKEVSFTPYPTPFLFNILEALVFKQQLRRMDFATASRIINAILLVTEGDKDFPLTEDTRGNLDELKRQIAYYSTHPDAAQRLFALFSNHTTKLSWIQPDVAAMLDQEKYRQTNDEISEGLGFAKILVTGESRNAQASEVSTWAIQPMMEELREMFIEWLTPVYEEAAELNGFRQNPSPAFAPIRLQDFVKTAAVFAQAFKEGNMSRTTRDEMIGLDFQTELERMNDEKSKMEEISPDDFPDMPYNITAPPGGPLISGPGGKPAGSPNKGGRPVGTQDPPVTQRNRGVKKMGDPMSKVKAAVDESGMQSPEEVFDLLDKVATEYGISLSAEDL